MSLTDSAMWRMRAGMGGLLVWVSMRANSGRPNQERPAAAGHRSLPFGNTLMVMLRHAAAKIETVRGPAERRDPVPGVLFWRDAVVTCITAFRFVGCGPERLARIRRRTVGRIARTRR